MKCEGAERCPVDALLLQFIKEPEIDRPRVGRRLDQGGVSLVEALKVEVVIEETDIDDLTAAIASVRHKDIKTVSINIGE